MLGASGWFGKTAQEQIRPSCNALMVASVPRGAYQGWDSTIVREFNPTVVLNFASLTADRLPEIGPERFEEINNMLIDRMAETAEQPSVRLLVTVSSGVVLTDPRGPYGRTKAREEATAIGLASSHRNVVVLRAYSMSGPHVQRPTKYALSSFILQARQGLVTITSAHPVKRRYTSVKDALYVATALGDAGWSGLLETGGDLVEMADLARRVVGVVNPGASIERPLFADHPTSTYASDNSSWTQACHDVGFVPQGLDQQIRTTAAGLMWRQELPFLAP